MLDRTLRMGSRAAARHSFTLATAFALIGSLAARPAAAQRASLDCFDTGGPAARGRSVTLARAFTVARGCRYGLSPDRIDQAPPARMTRTDVVALASALQAATQGAPALQRLPTVYACPAGDVENNRCREGTQQAAWLDTCTESIFLDPANFRVQQTASGFQVRPTASGARCDAGSTALWFVSAPASAAGAPPAAAFARRPAEARVLPAGGAELTLPTQSPTGQETRWVVYAAREADGEGYYVGALAPGQPLTPLQRFFAQHRGDAPGAPPLFRAEWRAGAVRFEPATAQLASEVDDEDTLRAEMRTAAAAGQLWLAQEATPAAAASGAQPGAATGAHARRGGPARSVVLGPLEVDQRAGDAPDFRITDRVVRAFMAARYGGAGGRLAPTVREWNELRDLLSICLVSSYANPAGAPALASGAPLPPDAQCLKLGAVAAQVRAASGSVTGAQLCVRHRLTSVVAAGEPNVLSTESTPTCVPFVGGAGGGASERAYLVAATGDALSMAALPPEARGRLFACQGARCVALPTDGAYTLTRGLVEVREADDEAGAASPQALSVARVAVIDPQRDWFPVGMHRVEHGSPAEARAALERNGPWSAVARESRDVFGFTRRVDRLQFRLVTSSALAAVADSRPDLSRPVTREPPLITRELPSAGAVSEEAAPAATGGEAETVAPRGSALVVLATTSPVCPRGSAAEARRTLVDPDALLVDEAFFAFLAYDPGGGAPYQCLARATFRVRPWRSFAIEDAPVRFGLLTDLQLGVFFGSRNNSLAVAFGAVLPVVALNVAILQQPALPINLSLEVAPLTLSIGVSANRGDLYRAGIGSQVSFLIGGGPVPRIGVIGIAFHYPVVSTSAMGDEIVSGFFGVNLSELLDLLGAR